MFTLSSPKTKNKAPKIGRGRGRKGGHTVGRGMKGQKSRSGYKSPRQGFEGGSMPLSRRLPKLRGFTRGLFKSKVTNVAINLGDLDAQYKDGEKVSLESLREKGLVQMKSKNLNVKILGDGELSKKVEIVNLPVSKSAQEKIEKVGGKIVSS
ncbi:50S ribosomal protein L15 [Candidatus Dojkabacteria bacterium]|uniref:Large ribosomal subunit protein uL15 n=1 Tax=Candidatus Dojkabacteria bacterium TaxID=2099670 RepID=A0A955RKH7_9BACT|nr:50S ribosomal protein L15 [Candidatus Dojkabacteria bacterium]